MCRLRRPPFLYMDNWFDSLVNAAAGYFGNEQKNDAAIELAKVGVQPVGTTPTPAAAATAAQWIPGVSNGLVIAGGAGLLALVVVVVIAKR